MVTLEIGRLYRRYQIRRYGTHPGGRLVFGEPWPYSSKLEQWLGKYIGFGLFASARKPLNKYDVIALIDMRDPLDSLRHCNVGHRFWRLWA